MSKKTSTKTATTKSIKATKKTSTKKPAAKPVTVAEAAGECPKGGAHEWSEEGNEKFCSKCKEPQGSKAKPTKGTKKAEAAKPAGDKKLSAIDAAAKLLGEAGEPMNCKAMIEAIAAKGYWTSPGGKTPHATLYSSIIREISMKGKESRFKKTDRGNFAFNG
jgi:hypothetical protein